MNCPVHDSELLDEEHLASDHSDAVRSYLLNHVDDYIESIFDEVAGDVMQDISILSKRKDRASKKQVLNLLTEGSQF